MKAYTPSSLEQALTLPSNPASVDRVSNFSHESLDGFQEFARVW